MVEKTIFFTCVGILILFNWIYITSNPTLINSFVWGAGFTGLLMAVILATILAGVNILGSGLSDVSIKVLFSSTLLLNILFKIEIAGITIGLGLASNIYDAFNTISTGFPLFNLGLFIAGGLAIMSFISGIIMVVNS